MIIGKPKAPPKQASNESRAVLRMYRISPQKLNLLAQSIRGRKVDKAIAELEFSRKRAAIDVLKVLKSAVANADNNHGLDIDSLVVAGSVDRVVDGILALRETVGDFGTLVYAGHDWADERLARRSMELMATKVMPAVNRAIGRSATAP